MASAVDLAVQSAFLANRRVAGEDVTYSDGTESATVTAIRGETIWEPTDSPVDGLTIAEKSVDWLILKSDLTDESVATPASGHTITDAAGQVYRVLPMGPSELVYRWHDRGGRTIYRIHSKERA